MNLLSIVPALLSPLEKIADAAAADSLICQLSKKVFGPYYWKKAFLSASNSIPQFSRQTAINLACFGTRPLYRLFLNTFNREKSFPTPDDFAIAIAMQMNYQDYKYKERGFLSPELIRIFARSVRKHWCGYLQANPITRKYLKDSRNLDLNPEKVTESCEPGMDSILSNKINLEKEYFKTYSHKGDGTVVRVWLPNEHEYIDFNPERTVDVCLELVNRADTGFFLVGYDYSLIRNGKSFHLVKCHLDKKRGIEKAEFADFRLPDENFDGPLLWSI